MSGGLLPARLAKRLAKPAYRAGDVLKLLAAARHPRVLRRTLLLCGVFSGGEGLLQK